MNVPPATPRQESLYTDLVDVYRAKTQETGADKRLAGAAAGTLDPDPLYQNQLCKWYPSSEYSAPSGPLGRTLQDNLITLDKVHFPYGVELQDGDVIHRRTLGDLDAGYYKVQGNSESWPGTDVRQSAYAKVLVKRIPQPAELA